MNPSYAPTVRFLHWLIAACVIGLVLAGLILKYDLVPKSLEHPIRFLHIGFGITMLALMALRLGLRLANPPPRLPGAIPAVERRLALAGHWAFYLVLFAMPVFGILFQQADGRSVRWFGLVTLPTVIGQNDAAHDLFYNLHFWGGITLIALFFIHVAAVLRHHRAGVPVLQRMWG